jgi:hypothetical protein
MSKINKKIIVLIVFLALLILWGFMKAPANMQTTAKEQVNNQTSVKEAQVAGLFVEFENETTEKEVKNILENNNMPKNYTIDYNSDIMSKRYYITVDKDQSMNVKNELRMEENWTTPEFTDVQKREYNVITVPEQIIHDKSFLAILEKNNLQVKNSVLCYIHFGDESKNGLLVEDALQIENELIMNEKVLTVTPEAQVAGLFLEFENGTTEPAVKAILENYNLTKNYTIDYNINYMRPNHYIKVDKDKTINARSELGKVENWNESEYVIKKGNYYIIRIDEEFITNKSFLNTIDKNNLQMNESVWCLIKFRNYPNDWIWSRYMFGIKHDLEIPENILTVNFDTICY